MSRKVFVAVVLLMAVSICFAGCAAVSSSMTVYGDGGSQVRIDLTSSIRRLSSTDGYRIVVGKDDIIVELISDASAAALMGENYTDASFVTFNVDGHDSFGFEANGQACHLIGLTSHMYVKLSGKDMALLYNAEDELGFEVLHDMEPAEFIIGNGL